MAITKRTTLWAIASLVCSILGCLAALALLGLLRCYGEVANGSAGVGIIWMFGHALLAATLCLQGVVFGIVALIRIRSGECRGKGSAWTGIVLGSLPLAAAVLLFLISNADSNTLR
jgi:hypothetical protein